MSAQHSLWPSNQVLHRLGAAPNPVAAVATGRAAAGLNPTQMRHYLAHSWKAQGVNDDELMAAAGAIENDDRQIRCLNRHPPGASAWARRSPPWSNRPGAPTIVGVVPVLATTRSAVGTRPSLRW